MRWVVCVALAALVSSCASMETARFQARSGQEAMVRDGQPAIVSRKANSLVIVRPASRQFQAGRRPVYVVGMYNLTKAPLQYATSNTTVEQQIAGQGTQALRVYTYEELVAEERNRQVAQALIVGLAAGANAMSTANAGRYSGNATVYGARGPYNVSYSGYDPTAAAIAQSRVAAQNDAMIANTIETGQRNLAGLEQSVMKDNTLLPGEWYGGQLHFDPPSGDSGKSYTINIQLGRDLHQIEVAHVSAS